MRRLILLLTCALSPVCVAQGAGEADDSTLPVLLGATGPKSNDCTITAKPGEQGYCLQPAQGMDIWLRSDDVAARITTLSSWSAPPKLRLNASSAQNSGETAWRTTDQPTGLPVVRFAERSSLRISSPGQYESFTLFAVARQAPGTRNGTLVSSSRDEGQGIGWGDGNSVIVRTGPSSAEKLAFAEAGQFHVLTIRSERGAAFVFGNGRLLNEAPVQLGTRFGVQFVGRPSSGETLNGLEILRALRMPANPSEGADIAELLVWPSALGEDQMRETLRYLRRKYALDFPLSAPGVLVTSAPAPAGTPAQPEAPADPLANYPAHVGRQFQRGSTCSMKARTPDEPGYCLHPTRGSVHWHRADDIFAALSRLSSWDSPLFSDLAQPDAARQPELINAQLGRYPVVRFEDERRLDFRTPRDLSRFTIFLVGRRSPTAAVGSIFGPGAGGTASVSWMAPSTLYFGQRSGDPNAFFSYPGQEKFHLLTLHGDGLVVHAFVNGHEVGAKPMPAGTEPFRIGHIGSGHSFLRTKQSLVNEIARGGITLGKDTMVSSEIAEIIVYDKVLDRADVEATERYLRKKYGLP